MQNLIAFVLLLCTSPVWLLLLLATLVTQGPPLFFVQERVGLRRKHFFIIKLGSRKDGHVTRFGRFLRKTGLDELPQLVNILKGDMKFIGPRPLTAGDITRLGWDTAEFDLRWSVKPGITGPAQLSNGRVTAF